MNVKKTGAFAALLLAGTAFLVAPAANAATLSTAPAGTVVAQDSSGMVIAQDEASALRATPSAPRAVSVSTKPGSTVTVTAKGAAKQSKKADKAGNATFTKLKAGTTYTVTANGKSTQVTPVVKAGRADDLTVTTTDRVGTVDLNWNYKNTKARGDVAFTVTATPLNTTIDKPISIDTAMKSAELTGLNANALYSFSVTPHNALGDGQTSIARMGRSLADITGLGAAVAQVADATPAQPTPAPQPAPAPAPKPGPAPAPKPNSKTIWVCPDGFADVNGVCTQSRDYTFHTDKQTQDYTYTTHSRVESCTGADCPGSQYVNSDTNWDGTCSQGTLHDGRCHWWTDGQRSVEYQVKDAPPMGWYDDGSQYARDVEVKDATPSGWSDNGSQWIRTTAKIEKVVPA